MHPDEVKKLIEAGFAGADVQVTGDGRHFDATVVSASFDGQNMLQRHRAVYAAVGEHMHNDVVHALTIKAFTPDEWAEQQG